jgi:hypothetical protein
MNAPKVLIFDIETSPIEAYVWGMWDQNVNLNQIKTDWKIISFAAKWLDEKKVHQYDLRDGITKSNEHTLLGQLWYLLNEADIVISQNGKSFDVKKVQAKFLEFKFKPTSSFQQIDTKLLAKKHFGFTSNSLEYMSNKFNLKYKKLKHGEFPGQDLWTQCLKGSKRAWNEMAKYNEHDVLATEELYKRMVPYDNTVNFNVYYGDEGARCTCGSTEFIKNGFCYTSTGKYQRFSCKKCGSELKSRQREPGKGPKFVGSKR